MKSFFRPTAIFLAGNDVFWKVKTVEDKKKNPKKTFFRPTANFEPKITFFESQKVNFSPIRALLVAFHSQLCTLFTIMSILMYS